MNNCFDKLSKVQFKFIEEITGLNGETLVSLTDDEVDDLYDRFCDMEVEEIIAAGDGELSRNGKMITGIVTAIGKTFEQ